jgi:hypothetical protein
MELKHGPACACSTNKIKDFTWLHRSTIAAFVIQPVHDASQDEER